MQQSAISRHLNGLSELNVGLIRLLDMNHILVPCPPHRDEVIFSHQDHGGEDREFFKAIQRIYTCSCATAHFIYLGCYCDACVNPLMYPPPTCGRQFVLAFPRRQDSLSYPPLLSAVVVLEPPSWSDKNGERYVGVDEPSF